MSRLIKLVTLVAAPVLALVAVLRGWFRRKATPGYFMVTADYPGFLVRGEAAAFCLEHARRHCRGQGVDVGAGRWPFPGARAVEDNAEENAYRLKADDASLDYVFSSHCLEHLEHWQDALREWQRVLKPGGILYLYLPHPACRMWQPAHLPYHVWQPEPDPLAAHLSGMGFAILEAGIFPDSYLSFHVVAQRQG